MELEFNFWRGRTKIYDNNYIFKISNQQLVNYFLKQIDLSTLKDSFFFRDKRNSHFRSGSTQTFFGSPRILGREWEGSGHKTHNPCPSLCSRKAPTALLQHLSSSFLLHQKQNLKIYNLQALRSAFKTCSEQSDLEERSCERGNVEVPAQLLTSEAEEEIYIRR